MAKGNLWSSHLAAGSEGLALLSRLSAMPRIHFLVLDQRALSQNMELQTDIIDRVKSLMCDLLLLRLASKGTETKDLLSILTCGASAAKVGTALIFSRLLILKFRKGYFAASKSHKYFRSSKIDYSSGCGGCTSRRHEIRCDDQRAGADYPFLGSFTKTTSGRKARTYRHKSFRAGYGGESGASEKSAFPKGHRAPQR